MFSFAFKKISVIICNNRIIKTFNMIIPTIFLLYIVILFIVTLFKQKTNNNLENSSKLFKIRKNKLTRHHTHYLSHFHFIFNYLFTTSTLQTTLIQPNKLRENHKSTKTNTRTANI